MPRPPHLQFPGAIYHIVTRGVGRRVLFHGDGHFARLIKRGWPTKCNGLRGE